MYVPVPINVVIARTKWARQHGGDTRRFRIRRVPRPPPPHAACSGTAGCSIPTTS